ncbi:MAG TPA: hypothetical protein VM266_17265 [Solirubrobacteraceae bacterium]|nr:hypothetical protein [Solirubrobacteraceae bacterium]
MNTLLIVLTLVEVLLLVVVLAGYLIAIARTLRNISKTLGLVTFGVRAIESQTAPIGQALGDVNAALTQVATALQEVVGEPAPPAEQTTSGGPTEAGTAAASPADIDSRADLPRPATP